MCKMKNVITMVPELTSNDKFREIFNSHLFWLNSHLAAFLDHDQGLLNLNIRRIQDLIEAGKVLI